VPASLHEPGHIDHGPPAIVFPNVSGVGTLARTDGAQPSYMLSDASCGGVYCHGNGQLLLTDGTQGLIRNPVWSAGSSQAACGACHGLPPRNPNNPSDPHRNVMSITQCINCHAASVTESGAIRINPDGSSTHIDGIVQLGGP